MGQAIELGYKFRCGLCGEHITQDDLQKDKTTISLENDSEQDEKVTEVKVQTEHDSKEETYSGMPETRVMIANLMLVHRICLDEHLRLNPIIKLSFEQGLMDEKEFKEAASQVWEEKVVPSAKQVERDLTGLRRETGVSIVHTWMGVAITFGLLPLDIGRLATVLGGGILTSKELFSHELKE